MSKITHASVRMYRMGTGDCFIIKFLAGTKEKFTMMVDCGTWSGSKEHLLPYVQDLKEYVNNHVDLLVVTHEHKDHVYLFDCCREEFTTDFRVDKIWMGWTEDDKQTKVKKWQTEYGDKKKALAKAARRLQGIVASDAYRAGMEGEYRGLNMLDSQQLFADAVGEFSKLQSDSADEVYVGGLAGMKIVKDEIANNNIEYYGPGTVIEGLENLEGIRFYVLGPPASWEKAKQETGGKGESYDHNKELAEDNAFAAAVLAATDDETAAILPFDDKYLVPPSGGPSVSLYKSEEWRHIDYDWLNNAGNLAMRINSITNNLSLALAIEFEDSGKVMLFPGDAEYGSWASWHTIKWNEPCRNNKPHFTEDLLSRTVFYKVAHHLSHHGTAERLGMEMMTHPDLVAMATLDYNVISKTWKNTMPNRGLLKALVTQTKGRLIVMNDEPLFYDLEDTIPLKERIEKEQKKMNSAERQAFKKAFAGEDLYLQFTVNGQT